MFHYLNYYRLTQRWSWPRTLPDNQRGVERGGQRLEVEGKDERHYIVCTGWNRTKAGTEMEGCEELLRHSGLKNDQTLKM